MTGRREKGIDKQAARIAVAGRGGFSVILCKFMGHTTELWGPASASAGLICFSPEMMAHSGIQEWQGCGGQHPQADMMADSDSNWVARAG